MFEKLYILTALAGLDFVEPRPAWITSAEGDNAGGGGGTDQKGATGGDANGAGTQKAGDGGKTFSQDDVNGLLARERRTWESKAAEGMKAAEAKLAELNEKLAGYERSKELDGLTGKDREIQSLKQTIAKLEGDVKGGSEKLALATKRAEDAITSFRTHKARAAVRDALLGAGAIKSPKALDQATRTMLEEGKAEVADTDDGGITVAFSFDGKRYDRLDEAAKLWLGSNDHFLATPGGGSGAKGPNGTGGTGNRALSELSEAELAKLAAQTR